MPSCAQARADAAAFEGEAWFGDDTSKWVVKARGEHVDGEGWESAELQGLYAKPIGPYFDLQAGVRADLEPKGRTYAALGVEGVAPYWIETKATAFLSDRGDLSARLEAAHDLRLTTRLILQSKVETNLAEAGSDAELGLRLRYEIRREFAPYVGVLRHRTFGDEATWRARLASGRARRAWCSGPGLVLIPAHYVGKLSGLPRRHAFTFTEGRPNIRLT
jgi:copper resistance protein B